MEETFSTHFKKGFLLTFTKELIRHSARRDIIRLQNIIESEEKGKPFSIVKPETFFTKEISEIKSPIQIKSISAAIARKPNLRQFTKPIARPSLFIPEPKFPEYLEYLKPIPVSGVEIDLSKINLLIKDPAVRIIEVSPDERVVVSGTMGTKPTDIILNKEDIDRIINKFSEVSKIPVSEGIYRVVVGNLILSAIISEVISSKFIIKKMIVNPINKNKQHFQTLPFQNNNLGQS